MPSAAKLQDVQILVIDHSQEMRVLIRDMLNQTGITGVHEARDFDHALEIIKTQNIHIVLVDWDLTPYHGVEVVKRLRDRSDSPNPFVPIIMLTGVADRERVFAARDAGVHEFLLKPISSKMLRDRIATVMAQPRAFVEAPRYFGPDRRRRRNAGYRGPERRRD